MQLKNVLLMASCTCETIYIDEFEIIEPATSYWRLSMWASLALLVTGLVVHFSRPYRPH